MPVIKIRPHGELCPEGVVFTVATGENLCKSLLAHGVEIEHACEMSRACTTCHVIVKTGLASLEAAEEDEDDLLDRAWGLTAQSRLSCQVVVGEEDLEIEIPRYTINYARENH